MRRATRAVSLATVVVLGLSCGTAEAQHRPPGGRPHGQQHPHRFHHRPLGARVFVAPFVPFVSYGAPSVVYAAPPILYSAPPPVVYQAPPSYGSAPIYAPPPTVYAPPSAPASAPAVQQDVELLRREVVFPSGRYVLRGDGVSAPYTWVWIPNPPSAPPNGSPASVGEDTRPLYAWTDTNGVTTWTDRLSKVPPEHRAAARRTF